MINTLEFKNWLAENTSYSARVLSNVVSRAKRADCLLPITTDDAYCYLISQVDDYKKLSVSVRSQIKKSIKLYQEYLRMQ